MSEPFGLGPIGQILIPVTDLDHAVAFYRDKLGMAFLFASPGMGFFDACGVRLFLGVPEGDQVTGPVSIYYKVDDIAAAVFELESRWVTFNHPAHMVHRTEAYELWMASLPDPDGNPVILMSERPLRA